MSKRTNRLSMSRAIAAANLKKKGLTHAEIAKQMGVDVKKVTDMMNRGERFSN